jgi:septal ring factor EnvC (AmiA/AmiB activator)
MGEHRPLSLTTCLGKIGAASRKLASLSLAQGLLRMIPGLPTAALASVVIMFFAWSCERQAHRGDVAQARQVKKQATEEISRLQQQAAGALRDAQQSAQAVRKLEAQRQQLAREAEGLRQSLESLRQQELARANGVATLPTSEVVSRVASRLQEQVSGVRGQGSGPAPNASSASSPAMVLSDQGVRKVETALIELDSCRQQTQVIGQQVSNCEQQAKLNSSMQEQQSGTIAKLNAALADKDQILARSEEAHRAELKATRGTWRARFLRAVEIFAGGFIAGVLVR